MQLIRLEPEPDGPHQLDLASQPQKVKQTVYWWEVGNGDSFDMAALGKEQMKRAWLPSLGKETSTRRGWGCYLEYCKSSGTLPGRRQELFPQKRPFLKSWE